MRPIYEKEDVQIFIDEDPVNPRKEFDNLGTMCCAHKRYNLGDEEAPRTLGSWDGVRRHIESVHGPCIVLPLYLLDHSGLSISTTSEFFRACDPHGFDWSQLGFIYVPLSKVRKDSGVKRISKRIRKRITDILVSEVETYDQYLRGEVYGYVRGEDSCWGFYMDPEELADAVLKGEV